MAWPPHPGPAHHGPLLTLLPACRAQLPGTTRLMSVGLNFSRRDQREVG